MTGQFWTRVTVEVGTPSQTATGNERLSWATLYADVEARVLPLEVDEVRQTWATPEEDAYEIHLRGAYPAIRPKMRVFVDLDEFDIRNIVQPPPFGDPVTRLGVVRITP